MKKKVLLLIALFAVVSASVIAQIPATLNLQGYIESAPGTPFNGNVSVRFDLYESAVAATAIYFDNLATVPVTAGYYEIRIGIDPANPFVQAATVARKALWYELTIDGTKQGRIEFDGVPFSWGSKFAETADSALYAVKAGEAQPIGPAGGILTGTYPNPGIDQSILGSYISSALEGTTIKATPTGKADGDIGGDYPYGLKVKDGVIWSKHIHDLEVKTRNIDTGAINTEKIAKPSQLSPIMDNNKNYFIWWDKNNTSGRFDYRWRYATLKEVLGGSLTDNTVPVWDDANDFFANSSITDDGTVVAIASNLNVTGNTNLGGTLGVAGATQLASTLDVAGATTLLSTLDVTGNTNLGGTLGVAGATQLASTLDVAGATTLLSTLDVTGATTLLNTLDVTGATILRNNLRVDGITNLQHTNIANGLTITSGGANITGTTAIYGDLYVDLDIVGAKDLTIAGYSTLNNGLEVNNAITNLNLGLNVNGGLTTLNLGLLVNHNATINGWTRTDSLHVNNGSLFGGKATFNAGADIFNVPLRIYSYAEYSEPTLVSPFMPNLNDRTLATVGYVKTFVVDPGYIPMANAAGDMYINSPMYVDNATTPTVVNSSLPLNIIGTLDVSGATTLSNTLGVTGATNLLSTLNVSGATTLSNTLGVTGATNLLSTLNVSGATTLSSTLGVTGATNLLSTLGVTGATTLSNTLGVTGATTLSNTLGVTGATNLLSTLNVSGATTLSSTLGVTGATNLLSTLNVSGATTLSSTLGVTGATNLLSTLGVTGATTLSSTLGVTGATNLLSTLGVTGATTLSNTLGVTGATTLSNTLDVDGAATFSSTAQYGASFATVANHYMPAVASPLDFATRGFINDIKDSLFPTTAPSMANGYIPYGVTNGYAPSDMQFIPQPALVGLNYNSGSFSGITNTTEWFVINAPTVLNKSLLMGSGNHISIGNISAHNSTLTSALLNLDVTADYSGLDIHVDPLAINPTSPYMGLSIDLSDGNGGGSTQQIAAMYTTATDNEEAYTVSAYNDAGGVAIVVEGRTVYSNEYLNTPPDLNSPHSTVIPINNTSTGIQMLADGFDGQIVYIVNIGTVALILNGLTMADGNNITIPPGRMATFIYVGTDRDRLGTGIPTGSGKWYPSI